MKTEREIMDNLVDWARVSFPGELRRMNGATDQKAAARELLLFRIGQDESFVHELPDTLIVKLGGEVDRAFDEREQSLAATIGAKLERRIR